jgi:hypothetical protein
VVTAGLSEFPIGDDGVFDTVVEVWRCGDVTAAGQADDEIGNWRGKTPDLMQHNDSSPRYARRH